MCSEHISVMSLTLLPCGATPSKAMAVVQRTSVTPQGRQDRLCLPSPASKPYGSRLQVSLNLVTAKWISRLPPLRHLPLTLHVRAQATDARQTSSPTRQRGVNIKPPVKVSATTCIHASNEMRGTTFRIWTDTEEHYNVLPCSSTGSQLPGGRLRIAHPRKTRCKIAV